jgi:molybdate transport system regulatory protein
MKNIQISNLPQLTESASKIKYFNNEELNSLVREFQNYYDNSPRRRSAGKYWLTFLFLRFTGARVSEVLSIDDTKDIDYRNSRIRLITLKRKKKVYRTIPVPTDLINELLRYLAEYPEERGKVFKIQYVHFYNKFKNLCIKAGIDIEKAHPHSLRHTRAIELINAGVPLNHIQALLGHSSILNTSIYLLVTGKELEVILKEKGLI